MGYLIDTNVLSELRKKQPDRKVVTWVQQHPSESLFLSVLTLGEIRKGVEQLPDSVRKLSLLDWLTVELPNYFVGRVLPVNIDVADQWGRLSANAGRPLAVIDALLAATAMHHHLTLVTRNTKDFADLDVNLLNPWENNIQG